MKELEGRTLAKQIRQQVREQAESYRQQAVIPTLAIVMATSQSDAQQYVGMLRRAASKCSIEIRLMELAQTASTEVIAETLQTVATDNQVHGIILQTPLPQGTEADELIALIPPAKDVDGTNPLSAGRLFFRLPAFAPATAEAVLALLDEYQIPLSGKQTVVIGRSRVVGKPLAALLLARDATVTICHSKTNNLAELCRQADIVVAAAGQAGLVTVDMVSPDCQIIDVGTNMQPDGQVVGDVEPTVMEYVAGLSPVPGGVGPVTTALLLKHVIDAVSLTTN